MRQFLVLVLIIWVNGYCFSQISIGYEDVKFLSPADSQKLFFHLKEHSFFKNNEYFNTLNEGATFPGFDAEPTLVYQAGTTIRLEGGLRLLKFFGKDGFYKTEPVFRFQYQPNANFSAILGTLYGGINHGLIEPLYRWQRCFTDPRENGVQLLWNSSQVKADVWLNWQKFILPNDPFQEELTYGTTLDWKILPVENTFNIAIPFQTTINHHGGQDISVDLPLRTILNYATGIKTSLTDPGKLIKSWLLEFWYLGYNDLSPQKLQAFKAGYGIFPRTEVSIKNFIGQLGYYHGEMFSSPEGETLFHNALIPFNQEKRPARELLTGKLFFKKQLQKGIALAVYAETYTDLKVPQTDYCYGFHLTFDNSFLLKAFK